MNKQKLKINCTITVTLAIILGTTMATTNNAWAANIFCPNAPPNPPFLACNGTNNADRIFGTANRDLIDGLGGDDKMHGFSNGDLMFGENGDDKMNGETGNDEMEGESGNDKISGDIGNDRLVGGTGADKINGGNGDDQIYHGNAGPLSFAKEPDGSKDDIRCGPGIDEAFINSSVDGDTTDGNCETVHVG